MMHRQPGMFNRHVMEDGFVDRPPPILTIFVPADRSHTVKPADGLHRRWQISGNFCSYREKWQPVFNFYSDQASNSYVMKMSDFISRTMAFIWYQKPDWTLYEGVTNLIAGVQIPTYFISATLLFIQSSIQSKSTSESISNGMNEWRKLIFASKDNKKQAK